MILTFYSEEDNFDFAFNSLETSNLSRIGLDSANLQMSIVTLYFLMYLLDYIK